MKTRQTFKTTLEFDIRQHLVPAYDSDKPDNDLVESAYNTINLMVLLMGDIMFSQLFETKWSELSFFSADVLSAKLIIASDNDLVYTEDIESIKQNVAKLADEFGANTWGTYIGDGTKISSATLPSTLKSLNDITDIYIELRRCGIFLPIISSKLETTKDINDKLTALLSNAASIKYREVFIQSRFDGDSPAIDAIRNAIGAGLLVVPSNYKCCDQKSNKCVAGNKDQFCFACGSGSLCVNCLDLILGA